MLNGIECRCLYNLLGITSRDLPTHEDRNRKQIVDYYCDLNRRGVDYFPSTMDNMRHKYYAYRMIETARVVLTYARAETDFKREIEDQKIDHKCEVWREVAGFMVTVRDARARSRTGTA